MSGDPGSSSESAARQPAVAAAIPIPEPTPVITVSEASGEHPPGTAAPPGGSPSVIGPADKPELAVGAAFAGGLALALILKRITS
jgi:hypothetical protein